MMYMMNDGIPLANCLPRHVYRLRSRNLEIGVFNPDTRGFIGIRTKFGSRYLFTEYHWDTGPPFGTATPYEDLGELPEGVELREQEPTEDSDTGRMVRFERAEKDGKWVYADDGEPIAGSPVSRDYKPLFDYLDTFNGEDEAGNFGRS